MATAIQPPQVPKSKPRSSPAYKPLSCTNCRQRKVKCNREAPCDLCSKTGVKCVFPARRVRASRNHLGRVDARDAELLDHIRRLETMLADKVERESGRTDIDGLSIDKNSSTHAMPISRSGNPGKGFQGGNSLDNQFADFVKQQSNSSRHLSSEFLSSLNSEFDCLRELIQGDFDTDDEPDDPICQDAEESDPPSSILFYGPDSFVGMHATYPTQTQNDILLKFYFSNVDPVCNVIHRPTAKAYFADLENLIDPTTSRFKFRSLEASAFAIYFGAVVSMSPHECLTHLGERKNVLVARYKRGTEAALVQVDFLSSLEITALQAFVIYIVVQHSLERGRHTWTLIGLAIRIAHSIGLHRDGDGRALPAFEAEMRRRLWWQILALDMKASEARGSDTAAGVFSTLIPCNLNDEDFPMTSEQPLQGKTCPTDMTISLLAMDALWTSRKISFRSPTDDPCLVPDEKGSLVREFVKRIESTYMANCDFPDERSKLLRTMSHYWIYKLLLNLHYPLQQRMPYTAHCGSRGLHLAISFLTASEEIEQHPSSTGLAWYLKSYVPWHAVAVVLAELISQPEGPHTDRAWEILDSRFQDWDTRIADVKEVMLWGLIKNLLRRASSAREQSRQVLKLAELGFTDTDPVLQGVVGVQSTADSIIPSTGYTQLDAFRQAMEEPLDFLDGDFSDGMDPQLNAAGNTHSWNDFTSDFSVLGGEFGSGMYGCGQS